MNEATNGAMIVVGLLFSYLLLMLGKRWGVAEVKSQLDEIAKERLALSVEKLAEIKKRLNAKIDSNNNSSKRVRPSQAKRKS